MPENTLERVQTRIRSACERAGRSIDEVTLVAVSKTHLADKIRYLHHLGQRSFGENYLDEAVAKQAELAELDIEWHFIGPIQSNKTRGIAERFDWVQSVDRSRIIRRLDDQRPPDRGPLNVLVQVNLDDEESKSGAPEEALAGLARDVAGRKRLRLRGLMAIPAPRQEPAEQLAAFRRLAGLFAGLRQEFPGIDTLSAGMSADLEAAIAMGSTMVRVGTDLFGERPAAP